MGGLQVAPGCPWLVPEAGNLEPESSSFSHWATHYVNSNIKT